MIARRGRWGAAIAMLALVCGSTWGEAPESSELRDIRITAPTMVGALMQFSQQTRIQLIFPTDGVGQINAPKLQGSFTPRAALERLLHESGLTFQFVNPRTVSVSVSKGPKTSKNEITSTSAAQ